MFSGARARPPASPASPPPSGWVWVAPSRLQIDFAAFQAGLVKLEPRLFRVTDAEMRELLDDFDTDGSGTISVVEFRDFCYRIPNLAWKASDSV